MKKRWKRLTALALALIMCVQPVITAHAIDTFAYSKWPVFNTNGNETYLKRSMVMCQGQACEATGGVIERVVLPANISDMNLSLTEFHYAENGSGVNEITGDQHYKDSGKLFSEQTGIEITPVHSGTVDYSRLQEWQYCNLKTGQKFVVPVIACKDYSAQEKNRSKLEVYKELAPRLVQVMKQYTELFQQLKASQNSASVQVGNLHPCDLNLVHKVAAAIQREFGVTLNYPDSHSFWVNSTGWTDEDAVDKLNTYWDEKYTEQDMLREGDVQWLNQLLNEVAPWYLNYLNQHKIEDPQILSFSINGAYGLIDEENRTIQVKIPNAEKLENDTIPEVETPDSVKAYYMAGAYGKGTVYFVSVPYDKATGVTYDSISNSSEGTYEYGVDLSRTWRVNIESGEPWTKVTEFAVEADGKRRLAEIDEDARTIHLSLPYGTDLTQIRPEIKHTGSFCNMEGQVLDFSDGQSKTLILKNEAYNTEQQYEVTVTAEKSGENRILSYLIGECSGEIHDNAITVLLPYGTVLEGQEAEIEWSEYAKLTRPENLQWGDNTYSVTAQSGEVRTYTVTITQKNAATGNKILSFSYGGAKGSIDDRNGKITMELPAGSPSRFAPEIQISDYATIEPESGVVQDFSSPVSYRVTAQNGDANNYTVEVTFNQERVPNPYLDDMEGLLNKIVSRYGEKANDDWEWLVEGIWQGEEANSSGTFSLANCVGTLNSQTSVAMTNLDRKIMTMTARGFDCSNLAKYNGGKPLIDSKGNEVDDLVKILYNYEGTYTINGPIFALIALDMGNYTIPADAVWTREKLVEKLIEHPYLSEGFGLDMVGMLMYAIAPYQNDPDYGEQVKKKLAEGVEVIQQRMQSDYSFSEWGSTNSETASQVICALSACGIDCHTDPRFSNGTESVLTRWLEFAHLDTGYFDHDDKLLNNAMATYQGAYTLEWYLNFQKNGGAGHPYQFYYGRQSYGRKLGTEAEILSFTLAGQKGEINPTERTIKVTVPKGMPLSQVTPELVLSDHASLMMPSLPCNFVENEPQPFVIKAEDGQTQNTWKVTVEYGDVASAESDLNTGSIQLFDKNQREVSYTLEGKTTTEDGYDIVLNVEEGIDLTRLRLAAELSWGADSDIKLDGKTDLDLSDWLEIRVTAQDKQHVKLYRIKVQYEKYAEITAFSLRIGETDYQGTISGTKIIISGVPSNADVTAAVPTIEVSAETTTLSPLSGVPQDFSAGQEYVVSGDGVKSRTYQVQVVKDGRADSTIPDTVTSSAKIQSFSVLGVSGEIDQDTGMIMVELPQRTDVSSVAPTVTVGSGCSVSPVSGEIVNLTSPVIYTVTNGTESKDYTVVVTLKQAVSQKLWEKMEDQNTITDHQVVRD